MNTCTILNLTGDITISWEDNNQKEIKSWIQSKIDEGCSFFIVEKKLGFIPVKTKVKDTKKLPNNGHVTISDNEAANVFTDKKVTVVNNISINQKRLETKEKQYKPKIDDVGAERLVNERIVTLVQSYDNNQKAVRPARNADEVLCNNTICSRRVMAG